MTGPLEHDTFLFLRGRVAGGWVCVSKSVVPLRKIRVRGTSSLCRCSSVVSAVVVAALEVLGGQEGVPNSTHGDETGLNSFSSR